MIFKALGFTLFSIGAFIAFLNIAYPLWIKITRSKKSFSLIPLAGGLFLFVGFFVLRDFEFKLRYLLWMFADIGCAPLLLAALFDSLIKKLRR